MTHKFCLLFDMDGTLVDTDHLHFEAWQELFIEHGRQIDLEQFNAIMLGAPNLHILSHFFPSYPPERYAGMAEDKETRFRDKVEALEPRLGLGELLRWAEAHDCPFAIVTNAPRPNAEHMLHALGMKERFDHLIIGEEQAHSKPHPAPYLAGLERLGGVAGHAVAFEDSINGIKAAVAAGIYTVGMQTNLPAETLLRAGASRVITDFHDSALMAWLEKNIAAG